jgi:alkanesulfonate monooxygenase SsuD/methylene tetrahydromethanopterin reductase-like flavin-dependent oxidoreductase (luciferase family)
MKVGLLSLGDLVTDPVTTQRRSPAQRHRNLVEQAVLAESVGFDMVNLGEHHACDYILSAPAVVLGAIAERTSRLRLSTGVALGVNNDPLRLAEDYATVDALSGGRVEPVVGRGTYFPHTFAALGQDPGCAKEVFAEHVELLVRLWSEEDVHWSGRHRAPLEGVTMHPRPTQMPRPPIWLGAGGSVESVDLAARLGLWLMLPTVFGTPEQFRPMVDRYCEQWERHGHDLATRRIGCCTHFFVAPTTAAARTAWAPRYHAYVQFVSDLIAWSTGGRGAVAPFDFDRLTSTIAVCGSPAEAVDRLGRFRDLLSLDTSLLMLDMGGMPDDELFAAIELTGAEVIPQLR